MSAQGVALSILLFPAAGALLLAGRGWRLPRIVTQIVGPGVVWLSFAATLWLFFNHTCPRVFPRRLIEMTVDDQIGHRI